MPEIPDTESLRMIEGRELNYIMAPRGKFPYVAQNSLVQPDRWNPLYVGI